MGVFFWLVSMDNLIKYRGPHASRIQDMSIYPSFLASAANLAVEMTPVGKNSSVFSDSTPAPVCRYSRF
jgi:hypothetical protein